MYDIIVVGGGPAGMTAALYARRNGKTVLVIEKTGFGGQITHSPRVENYPGTLSMSGNEFADKTLDQILAQGAEIEFEKVISVLPRDGHWIVSTEEGSSFESLTVILLFDKRGNVVADREGPVACPQQPFAVRQGKGLTGVGTS